VKTPKSKSSSFRKLAIAVATMAAVGGVASVALALDVTATDFVKSLNTYIQNGDYAAARDALNRLSALKVRQIKIGDKVYAINDLLAVLSNPRQSPILMAELIDALNANGIAYFVAENRVVASVDISAAAADLFPTGSAG
jgi:hypothetical protein